MVYRRIHNPLQLDARVLQGLPLAQVEELLTIYLEMARRCAHEVFMRAQQAADPPAQPPVPTVLRQRVMEDPPFIASATKSLHLADYRGPREQRLYLRIGEAAEYCHVHRNTMRAWIGAGIVPTVVVDQSRRIERKVLDELMMRAISGTV